MKVASIAVQSKDTILFLRRRDTGKWTLPGGHFEPDETPVQAAVRELWEETGIEADAKDLELLGTGTAGRYEIHSFAYKVPRGKIPQPHADNDPDEEAAEFLWFDDLPDNPHVPDEKNVTLALLGRVEGRNVQDLKPAKKLAKGDSDVSDQNLSFGDWLDKKATQLFGWAPGTYKADPEKAKQSPVTTDEQKVWHALASDGPMQDLPPDTVKAMSHEMADAGWSSRALIAVKKNAGMDAMFDFVRNHPSDAPLDALSATLTSRMPADLTHRLLESDTIPSGAKAQQLHTLDQAVLDKYYPNEGDADHLLEHVEPYSNAAKKLIHSGSVSPSVAFELVRANPSRHTPIHPKWSSSQIRAVIGDRAVSDLPFQVQENLASHQSTPKELLGEFFPEYKPFEREEFNPRHIDWGGESQPYGDYHEDIQDAYKDLYNAHEAAKPGLASENEDDQQAARDNFYQKVSEVTRRLYRNHDDTILYGDYRQNIDSIHRWKPEDFDDMEPEEVVERFKDMVDGGEEARDEERSDIEEMYRRDHEREQDRLEEQHHDAIDQLDEDAVKTAAQHPNLDREFVLDRLGTGDIEDLPESHRGLVYNPNLTEADLKSNPRWRNNQHVKTALAYLSPDDHNQSTKTKLKVPNFSTEKLRQLRDKVESMGGVVHQKKLSGLPPSIKPLLDSKGNISAQSIQQAIDSVPTTEYWTGNSPEHEWEGVQRHSDEPSTTFHVNYTNDHVRQMREAGVWSTFHKIQTMITRPDVTQHPLGPTTIGWVRHTGDEDGTHIDEVQSDLSQSRLTDQFRQAGIHIPEDHMSKIRKILWGDRKTGQDLLAEAFIHHHRADPKHHGKALHWPAMEIKNAQGANPPPDTYKRLPRELGFADGGKYGQLETQNGPHTDMPTMTSKITKALRSFVERSSTKQELSFQIELLSKALRSR